MGYLPRNGNGATWDTTQDIRTERKRGFCFENIDGILSGVGEILPLSLSTNSAMSVHSGQVNRTKHHYPFMSLHTARKQTKLEMQ